MPKQRTLRRKKRQFTGNQFVKPSAKTTGSEVSEEGCSSTSASNNQSDVSYNVSTVSARKLASAPTTEEIPQEGTCEHKAANGVYTTGYRFVDMEILGSVFSSLRCADCGCFTLALMENHLHRKGCASELRVFCQNCGWRNDFNPYIQEAN